MKTKDKKKFISNALGRGVREIEIQKGKFESVTRVHKSKKQYSRSTKHKGRHFADPSLFYYNFP